MNKEINKNSFFNASKSVWLRRLFLIVLIYKVIMVMPTLFEWSTVVVLIWSCIIAWCVSSAFEFIKLLGNMLGCAISGYKLLFITVGNLALKKANGKFKIVKCSNPEMWFRYQFQPPKLVNGKYPVVLSSILGDVICVALGAWMLVSANIWYYFIYDFTPEAFGSLIALLIGGFCGLFDVYNNVYSFRSTRIIMLIKKLPDTAKYEKFNQFCYNRWEYARYLLSGIRPKDVPIDLFGDYQDEDYVEDNNLLNYSFMYLDRLMDEQKYDEALLRIERLLSCGLELNSEAKSELIENKIKLYLIKGEEFEGIEQCYKALYDKLYFEKHGNCAHFISAKLAYELLKNRNTEKAKDILAEFERKVDHILLTGTIESEKQMMSAILQAGREKGIEI